jgi:hypothetical protein
VGIPVTSLPTPRQVLVGAETLLLARLVAIGARLDAGDGVRTEDLAAVMMAMARVPSLKGTRDEAAGFARASKRSPSPSIPDRLSYGH